MRASRRVVTWTVVPLLVVPVGCAARGVRMVSGSSGPPAPITEADRRACEAYSQKQLQKSVVGLSAVGVLLVPLGVALGGLGALGGRPDGIVLPFIPWAAAKDNAKENRATREAALQACLAPTIRASILGPEHPDVAQSLTTLADGYMTIGDLTQLEPLYQRALAIPEQALGPDHPVVAAMRDRYAALLRRTHHEAEATEQEARARTIRAEADSPRDAAATAESDTRPEATEASGPTPLAPATLGQAQ